MNKSTGRTFFDYLSEHSKFPWVILIIFIILSVLLILGFVDGNLSLNLWGIEINNKINSQPDTIYIYKTDTIKIISPVLIEKEVPIENKSLNIKKGDTSIISTNEHSNINLGGNQNVVNDNKGIVGNNNQVIINDEPKRHLNPDSEARMLELIEQALDKEKKDKNCCITISSIMGNSEALSFATEILFFLEQKHYNVSKDIGQFQRSPIIKGVQIGFSSLSKKESKCLEILVGYK
jgi:hypothetical protein